MRTPYEVKITGLTQYPLKSAHGINQNEATVHCTGLGLDRKWMIVDSKGQFQSQRNRPEMATIQVALRDQDQITVSHNGATNLELKIRNSAPQREVTLHGKQYPGLDCGQAASEWVTNLLGKDEHGENFRIVQFVPSKKRQVGEINSTFAITEYADAFPFLICHQATLDHLNRELEQRSLPAVEMSRFRPNIVIAGVESALHAFAEYDFKDLISIDGEVHFSLVEPCKRCNVTSVEQETGQILVKGQPLTTLVELNPLEKRGAFFGMNAVLTRGHLARIKSEDTFYLI
jgi:uncharacterized protein YcbX